MSLSHAFFFGDTYLNHVNKCLQRFGVWADWKNPYLTLDPQYEAAQVAGTSILVYPFICVNGKNLTIGEKMGINSFVLYDQGLMINQSVMRKQLQEE